MTDLESDQEREVFFGTTESTEHQDADAPQHQIEPQRLDNSTLARSSRSPVDERRENEVNQDSSPIWMRSAVKDMIDMQSQMSQALQGVTSLLTRLCQKDSNLQQERNNNNFSNTDRGQGEFHSRCRNRSQIDDRHSETDYDDRHTYSRSPPRSSERSRSDRRSHQCNVKLPAFTGKDEWKVWINRFETIAERHNWNDEQKLDNLLPKLEGSSGEFVYTQLKRDTLRNYRELICELNNRYRVIETPRTFAAKFSKRDQRSNETAEEYAAELKRLYDKAYNRRDSRTRKEDLVRRFLDGLRDEEVRWEVEYIKEPDDIDVAVYHVVNYIQTRKRHMHTPNGDKKRKFIRRTHHQNDSQSDSEVYDSDIEEDGDHAYRVPVKSYQGKQKPENKPTPQNGTQAREVAKQAGTGNPSNTANTDTCTSMKPSDNTETLQQVLQKMVELLSEQKSPHFAEGSQGTQKKVIRCYSCNQENHFARDCPMNNQRVQGGQRDNRLPATYRPFGPSRQGLNVRAPVYNQPLNMSGPSRLAGGRS